MTPRRRATAPAGGRDTLDDRIVDTAVALAEDVGWENVRLTVLARRLGIPVPELQRRFRDPDAIADAFFARAARAVVAPLPKGVSGRAAPDRLALVMGRWFETLAPHRRVAIQMLRAKLYSAHPHHWVPLIFHLSRLIQSVRDAAGLDAPGRRRQIEEIGLTSLFLVALGVWANDRTPHHDRTRRVLARGFGCGETILTGLFSAPKPSRS